MKFGAEKQSEEVGFVTKRALVTFTRPVCLMINGTAVFCGAAICEMQESEDNQRFSEIPRHLRVIGLPDGRKISKSYNITTGGFGEVSAIVELDDDDLKGLVS